MLLLRSTHLCWSHYVDRNEGKEIYYHTFHSTKGLKYGTDIDQDLPKLRTYVFYILMIKRRLGIVSKRYLGRQKPF